MSPRRTRNSKRDVSVDNPTNLISRISNIESQFTQQFADFKHQMSALKGAAENSDKALNIETLYQEFIKFEELVDASFKVLRDDVKQFFTQVDSKMDDLVQASNADKLLLYGIGEEGSECLISTVTDLFKNKLNITIHKNDLSNCYRFGKKSGDNPRPVVVGFLHIWQRNEVFYNKSLLKDTKIVIAEMLTTRRYELYRAVRGRFKNNCWTKNGIVFFLWNDRRYSVTTKEDFMKIVAE